MTKLEQLRELQALYDSAVFMLWTLAAVVTVTIAFALAFDGWMKVRAKRLKGRS